MSDFEPDADLDLAWCPGCGNFAIRKAVLEALDALELEKSQTVFVCGIGQAAKLPQYLDCSYFNGLHGRSLPVAVGIKAVAPGLSVVVEGGDGDMYGEGGNHFLHTVRRNLDVVHLVHDNMVYGLTKGQASPTSQRGFVTPVQTAGVALEPFNPLAVALTLGAGFVARGFSGDIEGLAKLIVAAHAHRGYALIDILQPCPSFNKVNTFKWYKEHTCALDDDHDPSDWDAPMRVARDLERLALGVVYRAEEHPTFSDRLAPYADGDRTPLRRRERDMAAVAGLLGGTPLTG